MFKKSFYIELVKESARTEENDNDSLSLAISLFVSFMMQADLVVYCSWIFWNSHYVITDFIYFVQPS